MISVEKITKSFGETIALDNVSFSIKEGEIVGLLGPNGAGKTTSMRILSGFLSPDSGKVTIDDVSVLAEPEKAQAMIGYLPENNPLYQDMLVSEMLDFSMDLKNIQGEARKQALDFVVNSVNIADVYYRPIHELSKGYKQRVGIATALLHKPKTLIMDEPTEGLDPNQRTEIRTLIKKLAKEHTIVISTHVMQEVEAICSRAILINKGKVKIDGSVEELVRGAQDEKVIQVELEGKGIKNVLAKVKGIKKLETLHSSSSKLSARLIVDIETTIQPELSKLIKANNWTIWQLHEEKLQLEDVFKQLTQGA